MRMLIMIIIICLSYSTAYSESSGEKLFNQANQAYAKGDFEKAAAQYEKLLSSGYNNPALHYNLGNTYYRMDNIAHAILHYEKAKKMDPSNDDVNFNLQLANTKTVDKINSPPKLFIYEWYESLSETYGSGGWAGAAIIFIWIAAILLAFFIYSRSASAKKALFAASALSLTAFIFSIAFASASLQREKNKSEAIVMTANVYIKSSPDNTSQDLFILHEGAKVKIIDSMSGWFEIKISDGNKGWAPKEALETI